MMGMITSEPDYLVTKTYEGEYNDFLLTDKWFFIIDKLNHPLPPLVDLPADYWNDWLNRKTIYPNW